jgi:hypothetical protein
LDLSACAGLAPIVFNATAQLQRPALVISNGAVFIAYGSNCDHFQYYPWWAPPHQRLLPMADLPCRALCTPAHAEPAPGVILPACRMLC